MTDRFTTEDGCCLAYEVSGDGLPVLWQHGLGADRKQPAEVFPDIAGVQRITLECRGHGESDLGDPDQVSIAQFASDAIQLLDHLGLDKVVVGGISLGAAIAMRLAATAPARLRSLILARPAWVDAPAPLTMKPYLTIASLLKSHGPEEGSRHFLHSEVLAAVELVSPDNAASLRSFFSRKSEQSTIELLSRIPMDGPGLKADEIAKISTPTIVIANGEEFIHPLRYALQLRDMIPGSTLRVITSKTVNKDFYRSQFSDTLASFLKQQKGDE